MTFDIMKGNYTAQPYQTITRGCDADNGRFINRESAGGCTERNPFPYMRDLRVIQADSRTCGIKA